jgi:hypothetical protein
VASGIGAIASNAVDLFRKNPVVAVGAGVGLLIASQWAASRSPAVPGDDPNGSTEAGAPGTVPAQDPYALPGPLPAPPTSDPYGGWPQYPPEPTDPIPPTPTPGPIAQCPPGYKLVGTPGVCMPLPPPSVPPIAPCPAGYELKNGACVPKAPTPTPTTPCPTGYHRNSAGVCVKDAPPPAPAPKPKPAPAPKPTPKPPAPAPKPVMNRVAIATGIRMRSQANVNGKHIWSATTGDKVRVTRTVSGGWYTWQGRNYNSWVEITHINGHGFPAARLYAGSVFFRSL